MSKASYFLGLMSEISDFFPKRKMNKLERFLYKMMKVGWLVWWLWLVRDEG